MPRLFLGNISYNLDEGGLAHEIAALGVAARDVKIIMDKETGRPKGFGFCDVDDAEAAIAILKGAYVDGRPLHADMATRQDDHRAPREGNRFSNRPHREDDRGSRRGR